MNEQEFARRAGELATRIGYPMPSVEWADRRGRYVTIDERRASAPVLLMRPEVAQWCSSLRDVMIAQTMLCARFGMYRHHRQLKIWGFGLTAAVALVLGFRFGSWAYVWPLVAWALLTAASAIYARRLFRKVDPELIGIFGPAVVLEALEQQRCPLTPASFLGWLWGGAGVLAAERIKWLRASVAGNSSVAD